MGRIFVEMISGNIVVTRYESDGFVIPDNISQKKKVVAIINSNLDSDKKDEQIPLEQLAVPREEFLSTLLGLSEKCQEKYITYGKGLYSMEDMRKGITWAEVAYLLYYVGGIDKSLDWNSIRPRQEDRVCVLHEIVYGKKGLDEKLASYKNRLDMEYYIRSIISGSRYIPLPLYCSFVDLCNNDSVSELNLDMSMMFKKMSKHELNLLF